MTIGKRIKTRRQELGLSVNEVASRIGVSPASVYRYENETVSNLPAPLLNLLSWVLQTTVSWIIGEVDLPADRNIRPVPQMKEWEILGDTACGDPIAREGDGETIQAPAWIQADCVFRCVGDSMIGARIYDKDVVFVKKEDVANGDIAVVRIDGEYSLKRVYRGPDYLELRPENPSYSPIFIRGEQVNCEIVGKAVYLLGRVR